MLTVVVYDLSDDTSRLHFIKKLQYYGLKRLQKSVFVGYLDNDERFELADDLETYLFTAFDSIVIFPLCKNCKDSILLVGEANIPQNDLTYRFL